MDEIRRIDRQLFIREFATLQFVAVITLAIICLVEFWPTRAATIAAPIATFAIFAAHRRSLAHRFSNQRFRALADTCADRLKRFEIVFARLKKHQVADLTQFPLTVRGVGDTLYCSLRRADRMEAEIQESEKGISAPPPITDHRPTNAENVQLYQLADKNLAEYRRRMNGVVAGIQRTEAQAAVYITTLDNLRLQIIGHSMAGREVGTGTAEMLDSLNEAKLQLNAIDKALEELDMNAPMIAAKPLIVDAEANPAQEEQKSW